MQSKPTDPPAAAMTITDVYNILFKRKRLILCFSALGIAAAIGLYFLAPPPYVSEAKLLIRYVEDNRPLSGVAQDAQFKPVDSRGEGVLDTEANILGSLDVAKAAAETIGPQKILGPKAPIIDSERAAMAISKHLTVDVPRKGNVLRVVFEHPDINLVQPVLRTLIEIYYKKHVEFHKNLGPLDEFLTQETDQLRQSLTQTEEELRKLKKEAGVVSMEESRQAYSERYTELRKDLDAAEAELSERTAALKELQKATLTPGSANTTPETNEVSAAKADDHGEAAAEYKRLVARLDAAYKHEEELLEKFTDENSLVKANKAVIASLETLKKQMESSNPRLLNEASKTTALGDRHDSRGGDLTLENARVAALQARVSTLKEQVNRIKADSGVVDEIETRYLALQRKKELQEKQYKYYSTSLDQARVDSQMGAGKLSNISEIQAPSLPVRDTKALKKAIIGALAGGIGGGIALAFLLEMILNQTIRNTSEIETGLQVPVFLTIPWLKDMIGLNSPKALIAANVDRLNETAGVADGQMLVLGNNPASGVSPWQEEHILHPYAEGLRDRLVTFFELKGMKHKPKLIALTSCSRGAGVTTLASGLAASLSETGEGNVLLVDMNTDRGAAHPFYRGKPACGLADLLEDQKPDTASAAKIQDNLYVVHAGGRDDRLQKIVPNQLAHLLPKLQQTDYDYIIFDMPPITQTSVTPRLAGFMDMVFVVVESEKTDRNWLRQAGRLLKQSNTNVAAVFNKRRQYTPRWLHQEF
jgi:uncharacterized protein involved in exopolysaccharide biosynthesis/Mrp family chromosome partitioning ATPase